MTRYVLDASVLVKWALPERGEPETRQALELLEGFVDQRVQLIEPPHWLAEVAAVLARLAPGRAAEIVARLHEMEIPVFCDAAAYELGVGLAVRSGHHLFDTLYHAVALTSPDATLVTADDAYFRKALSEGRIRRLADVS